MCYEPSELLFKKGDAPRLFYIVVKGCVNIYLTRDRYQGESKIDGVTLGSEEARRQGLIYCNKIRDKFGNIDLSLYIDDPFFFDQKTYDFKHHLGLSIHGGNSFGELAVMRSAPRAATAISSTKTYLAALDSDSFRRILHFEQNQKIEKKMRFFKENLLGEMDYNDQVKIAYYFTSKKYKKNQIIYRQGDTVGYMYIIKKGRIELHTQRNTDIFNLSTIEKDKNLRKILQYNAQEIYGIVNNSKLNQKVTEIGEKNILADWIENTSVKGTYQQMYTSLCVTEEVDLYECTFHNFIWIKDNYPKLWSYILHVVNKKNRSRTDYINKSIDIRNKTYKNNKGITSNNIQVKLFAIQNNSVEYSNINKDEHMYGNNSNKEDIKHINDIIFNKRLAINKYIRKKEKKEEKYTDRDVIRSKQVYDNEIIRHNNIKLLPGDIRQSITYTKFMNKCNNLSSNDIHNTTHHTSNSNRWKHTSFDTIYTPNNSIFNRLRNTLKKKMIIRDNNIKSRRKIYDRSNNELSIEINMNRSIQ